MSSPPTGRLEVGAVSRAHGLHGEVVVHLVTNRQERVAPGSVLWLGDRPLTVRASSPHLGRYIVSFEGIDRREEAEALRGAVLHADPVEDPDALWVHELIGSELVGTDGVGHGRVVSVQANPASDLLVLDTGGLVPLVFVRSHGAGRIVADIPAGLFDQ